MKIPLIYNVRSVLQRPVSTALTALGIALVVAVFIGMLALANGFAAALARTGSDRQRAGAPQRRRLRAVERHRPRGGRASSPSSPHVGARRRTGAPLVSPESVRRDPARPHRGDTHAAGQRRGPRRRASRRGRCAHNVKVVAGPAPASGQNEVCVGAKLVGPVPEHRASAQSMRFAGRPWDGGLPLHRGRVGVRVRDLGRERAVHAGVPAARSSSR